MQQFPQFQLEYVVTLGISGFLVFLLCFLITAFFITPKIRKVKIQRAKISAERKYTFQEINQQLDVLRAEIEEKNLNLAYSKYHKDWEVEYRKLTQDRGYELYIQEQNILKELTESLENNLQLQQIANSIFSKL